MLSAMLTVEKFRPLLVNRVLEMFKLFTPSLLDESEGEIAPGELLLNCVSDPSFLFKPTALLKGNATDVSMDC